MRRNEACQQMGSHLLQCQGRLASATTLSALRLKTLRLDIMTAACLVVSQITQQITAFYLSPGQAFTGKIELSAQHSGNGGVALQQILISSASVLTDL